MEDLLDPNRNVDVAFRSTQLRMKDGRTITGLFRRQEGATLVLVDGKGQEFSVLRAQVDDQRQLRLSPMPENVPRTLSEPELYDLVQYLLAQRGPSR